MYLAPHAISNVVDETGKEIAASELVDALAATEMRALAAKLLPRVDACAAAALLQNCGRRLQRFAAQHET